MRCPVAGILYPSSRRSARYLVYFFNVRYPIPRTPCLTTLLMIICLIYDFCPPRSFDTNSFGAYRTFQYPSNSRDFFLLLLCGHSCIFTIVGRSCCADKCFLRFLLTVARDVTGQYNEQLCIMLRRPCRHRSLQRWLCFVPFPVTVSNARYPRAGVLA